MPVDVGTIAPVQWKQGLNEAGHTVTLTVVAPDATSSTPTVSEAASGTGVYTADVDTAAKPGRYVLQWQDETSDVAYVDTLEVWPADPRFLISLDDAMDSLKWPPGERAANGEKLRLYVAAATDVIEDITGTVLIRTIEQYADGGRSGVALWERPSEIVEVRVGDSVTTDYIPNLNAAIVYAGSNGAARFPAGRQNVRITYRAGAAAVSPSIQLAARELVRHLWQVGQQALTGNPAEIVTQDPRQMGMTRSGFAVPNRVIELCGNHHALPGIA